MCLDVMKWLSLSFSWVLDNLFVPVKLTHVTLQHFDTSDLKSRNACNSNHWDGLQLLHFNHNICKHLPQI